MTQSGGQLDALLDLSRQLRSKGIRYALIGGIAVGIRSDTPRATDDIDIAVATSSTRRDVISALEAAAFELTGEYEHSVNLRHPSGEPVQVAFDPFFDDMVDRAEALDVGGVPISVVTHEDLIRTKERAAADPSRRKSKAFRDRADIELLRGDVPTDDEGW